MATHSGISPAQGPRLMPSWGRSFACEIEPEHRRRHLPPASCQPPGSRRHTGAVLLGLRTSFRATLARSHRDWQTAHQRPPTRPCDTSAVTDTSSKPPYIYAPTSHTPCQTNHSPRIYRDTVTTVTTVTLPGQTWFWAVIHLSRPRHLRHHFGTFPSGPHR